MPTEDSPREQPLEALAARLYDDLRRLAAHKLANEKPGQTLQATALVHEAYIRLVDVEKTQQWDGRGHFFAAVAEAMRRILVDQARRKQAEIHGGGRLRITLSGGELMSRATPEEVINLDDALTVLAREDAAARGCRPCSPATEAPETPRGALQGPSAPVAQEVAIAEARPPGISPQRRADSSLHFRLHWILDDSRGRQPSHPDSAPRRGG